MSGGRIVRIFDDRSGGVIGVRRYFLDGWFCLRCWRRIAFEEVFRFLLAN